MYFPKGGFKIEVAVVTTSINRKTGKKKIEVVETKKVNEDEFYEPLVRILGENFLKEWGCKYDL